MRTSFWLGGTPIASADLTCPTFRCRSRDCSRHRNDRRRLRRILSRGLSQSLPRRDRWLVRLWRPEVWAARSKSPDIDGTAFVAIDRERRASPRQGHGGPCLVSPSSFRFAGSPLGFVALVNRRAGVSRPLSRRVAAGAADLGRAGPRPARGRRALLVRKPAPLDPAAPDPETPSFRRFFPIAPEGRTGRCRPKPSGRNRRKGYSHDQARSCSPQAC